MAAVTVELDTSALELGPEGVQVLEDLEVLVEDNKCSCAASDDNPY